LAEESFDLIPVSVATSKPLTRTAIDTPTKEKAYQRAGYSCSFPGCKVPLGEGGIGEIAHIQSLSEKGPISNPNLTSETINNIDNLVVLCPTHHRMIDKMPEKFSPEVIRGWNRKSAAQDKDLKFNAHQLFTIGRIILNIIRDR